MYRAYHFSNYYLSSIQQGIQAAHAQTNLFLKYRNISMFELAVAGERITSELAEESKLGKMLYEWAEQPTMICLNGGNHVDLLEIKRQFEDLPYPNSCFNEDLESLNGMLTNVCIVLPKKIWGAYDALIKGKKYMCVTDKGMKTKTFGSFESFYEYANNNNGEAFAGLCSFEYEFGKISESDAKLIGFLRGFRLAS